MPSIISAINCSPLENAKYYKLIKENIQGYNVGRNSFICKSDNQN